MVEKSIKELLNEIESLKKANLDLKSTLKINEDYNSDLLNRERLIAEIAMELVELPYEYNLYDFAASRIAKIFPKSVVLVTAYEDLTDSFKLGAIHGLDDKKMAVVEKLMGINSFSTKVKFSGMDEVIKKGIFDRKFITYNDGIYSATGGAFSKKACYCVEKITHVTEVGGMAFLWENQLYGTVSIISYSENLLEKKEIIETIVNMISVALQKKQAKTRIKETLKEKELLMKEIHHRAHNNLSLISSLLSLQSKSIKDKETLGIFRESQARARSMALIHECIYRSSDLKRIDFGDYLKSLSTIILKSCTLDTQQIGLNFDIKNLMLDIDTAVPLGLIVTELITNSIKYAFSADGGTISIKFYEKNSYFFLHVLDNGIGLPDNFNLDTQKSLGMQIVTSLIKQTKAQMDVKNENGAEFIIKFREKSFNK